MRPSINSLFIFLTFSVNFNPVFCMRYYSSNTALLRLFLKEFRFFKHLSEVVNDCSVVNGILLENKIVNEILEKLVLNSTLIERSKYEKNYGRGL